MQTSIEWLIDKVEDFIGLIPVDIIEQAKEMHRQEIINAHNSGFDKSSEGWNGEYGVIDFKNLSEEIGSEQYYQETFKKD